MRRLFIALLLAAPTTFAQADPARMTGMAKSTGSIQPGKIADILLVDGDVSKDIINLRHVDTVFLDGYRLKGEALRQASGLSGMPK